MFEGPVRMRVSCAGCARRFEFHPGNWSGAVMISQMLMGIVAIPVWVVLGLVVRLDFATSVWATVAIVMLLWFVTYRNVKGMWTGWLFAMHPDDGTRDATPLSPTGDGEGV